MDFFSLIAIGLAAFAISKARDAQRKVEKLRRDLETLSRAPEKGMGPVSPEPPVPDAPGEDLAASGDHGFTFSAAPPAPITPQDHPRPPRPETVQPPRKPLITREQIKSQWMVWLGGICVGLAGIFLVKYSIERGFLGPRARIMAGLLSGVVLHVAAKWWRRKNPSGYGSIAALAAGGSITLFAALLAGLHLYHLWPPAVAFAGLTIVSVATMWLALLHGPILAILGILGAYIVPLLVNTGSHDINTALAYSLIISLSAFLLLRRIFRDWLWWGTIAGGMFWFLASLFQQRHDSWNTLYLAIFGYLMLALTDDNLRLSVKIPRREGQWFFRGKDLSFLADHRSLGLLILIGGQCLALLANPDLGRGIMLWIPLLALVLLASRHNRNLHLFPWVALLTHLAAIVAAVLDQHGGWALAPFRGIDSPALLTLLPAIALLFSGMSFWNRSQTAAPNLNASLTWFAPVLCLAAGYICRPEIHGSISWTLGVLLLGAGYGVMAGIALRRGERGVNTAWLVIAGHAAYSLATVIYFSEASLTLALSCQIVSLIRVARQFELIHIHYAVKAILTVVVIRLTLNPWLLSYPETVHWSLWTYGGSFAAVALSARLCSPRDKLRPWLEGASLHLLILFLNTELRYWLYDGRVFTAEYSFTEAAINTNLWAGMAMVYQFRGRVAAWAKKAYQIGSYLLMLMALVNFGLVFTYFNPLINQQSNIGATPVLNLLLVAYGLPVIMWGLSSRFFSEKYRNAFLGLAAFCAWFFVTLQIRHFWLTEGETLYLRFPLAHGELYTYSLVWLLMGVTTFSLGIVFLRRNLYRAGLVFLGLVIAKIFLVDMEGLGGLYRVFSFMGLGLSLLGLAYLHQRLDFKHRAEASEGTGGT
jgi:uncharacterized membrane protein